MTRHPSNRAERRRLKILKDFKELKDGLAVVEATHVAEENSNEFKEPVLEYHAKENSNEV